MEFIKTAVEVKASALCCDRATHSLRNAIYFVRVEGSVDGSANTRFTLCHSPNPRAI